MDFCDRETYILAPGGILQTGALCVEGYRARTLNSFLLQQAECAVFHWHGCRRQFALSNEKHWVFSERKFGLCWTLHRDHRLVNPEHCKEQIGLGIRVATSGFLRSGSALQQKLLCTVRSVSGGLSLGAVSYVYLFCPKKSCRRRA